MKNNNTKILATLALISPFLMTLCASSYARDIQKSSKFITIVDTVGGNENYLKVNKPDEGEPLALPNPSVFQKHNSPFKSVHREITLQPGEQTETKVAMLPGQVVLYSWRVNEASIYSDFHGHEPKEETFFVRYEELEEGQVSHGSLAAPFDGHHGWYWLNLEEVPVTLTLDIQGYFVEFIDYEVTSSQPY
jgi:hypothetical protein